MTREIILDTETTGLETLPDGQGDRIIEIGCVELINGQTTNNTFQKYINPGKPVPEESFKIHGLSDEFLADKPKFAEIVEEFLQFIGDSQLIIHNAEFDMKFINAELTLCQRPTLPDSRATDTLDMARQKYPNQANRLDDLCKRLNVDNTKRDLHGALLDAELLAQVYIRMNIGEQKGFQLNQKELSKVAAAPKPHNIPNRKAIVIAPDTSEDENHQKFLKFIENPIWLTDTLTTNHSKS